MTPPNFSTFDAGAGFAGSVAVFCATAIAPKAKATTVSTATKTITFFIVLTSF
jgi:hypothetical protein